MGAPTRAGDVLEQAMNCVIPSMRDQLEKVRRHAQCEGSLDSACQRPNEECLYFGWAACSARLREVDRANGDVKRCRTVERLHAEADLVGIPKRLRLACGVETSGSSDRLEEGQLFQTVEEVVARGGVAFLAGTPSQLPSRVAACLTWQRRRDGALWYPARGLAAAAPGDPSFRRLENVRFLAIDGIHDAWYRPPGWHHRNLLFTLTSRYEACLGTTVVTDMDQESLCRILGRSWRSGAQDDVCWFEIPEYSQPRTVRDVRPSVEVHGNRVLDLHRTPPLHVVESTSVGATSCSEAAGEKKP